MEWGLRQNLHSCVIVVRTTFFSVFLFSVGFSFPWLRILIVLQWSVRNIKNSSIVGMFVVEWSFTAFCQSRCSAKSIFFFARCSIMVSHCPTGWSNNCSNVMCVRMCQTNCLIESALFSFEIMGKSNNSSRCVSIMITLLSYVSFKSFHACSSFSLEILKPCITFRASPLSTPTRYWFLHWG